MKAIVHELVVPFSARQVWKALTDQGALASWLMTNDFEPRVGRRFQFRDKPRLGFSGIVDCEVTQVDELRRLAYSWQGRPWMGQPTMVTWTLTPESSGTRIRLEHSGFHGIGGWFAYRFLRGGWARLIESGLLKYLGAQSTSPL